MLEDGAVLQQPQTLPVWEPAAGGEKVTADGFSAVGYHFDRALNENAGAPVGMVHSAWSGAKAQIEDDTVTVSAEGMESPKAVRYGWANVPDVNPFNEQGLPASPFRTDID